MKPILRKGTPTLVSRMITKATRRWNQTSGPRHTTPMAPSGSTLSCCISYNQYGGYCVPVSSQHRPAAQRILSGEVWEPETVKYLISNCQQGDIVHAGAYFGDFLPALSSNCPSDTRIWAFEPNRENYRCAQITTRINDLKNVELLNAGLGEHKTSLLMLTKDTLGRSLGGASSVCDAAVDRPSEQVEVVDIVSADEIVPAHRNVSIVQLDVEGYEQQALSGALKTIGRCRPLLVLESLPDRSWFSENILSLGYEAVENVDGNTILVNRAATR